MLYAGGPDRVAAPLDVDGALGAIDALAAAVQERAPDTPVLLLGLLPSTRTRGAEADALRRIDRGIARIALEHGFAHVDFRGTALVDPDGALVEAISTDGLHLDATGYAILAERLRAAPEPFASDFAG